MVSRLRTNQLTLQSLKGNSKDKNEVFSKSPEYINWKDYNLKYEQTQRSLKTRYKDYYAY